MTTNRKNVSFSLSPLALACLDQRAEAENRSRSNMLEQILRGLYGSPCPIDPEGIHRPVLIDDEPLLDLD